MPYAEIKPHPALMPYIDCYWTAASMANTSQTTRILPDGCVDIILNLYDDRKTALGEITMKSETAYLIGTMTTFKENNVMGESKVLGIRFKPGAFPLFYRFSSLHEITDRHIEFDTALAPDIHKTIDHAEKYLDHFYLQRLLIPKHHILPLVTDVHLFQGRITVKELAQRHFTTPRQLERHFRYQTGLSPKEFINLSRYQFAHRLIAGKPSHKTLLQIAVEAGYYDHAHLSNDVKKYTGIAPSLL